MANKLTANPIYVDTPPVPSYKGSVVASLGKLFTLIVTKVRWVNPNAVGDQVTIEDPQNGSILLQMRNPTSTGGDIEEDWSASPRLWSDFAVGKLDSGRLLIYTK